MEEMEDTFPTNKRDPGDKKPHKDRNTYIYIFADAIERSVAA